jgi:hypothetical protein
MTRLVLVGFLVACNASSSMSSMPPNPDGPTAVDVTPATGMWQYGEFTPVSNTCGSAISTFEDGNFAIDSASSASFHIVPRDGTAPFTCALSHGGFDCRNRADRMVSKRPAVDAVITVHATASGSFSTPTAGTGQQHVDLSCTGTQCTLAPFPCAFTVDFSIFTQR